MPISTTQRKRLFAICLPLLRRKPQGSEKFCVTRLQVIATGQRDYFAGHVPPK